MSTKMPAALLAVDIPYVFGGVDVGMVRGLDGPELRLPSGRIALGDFGYGWAGSWETVSLDLDVARSRFTTVHFDTEVIRVAAACFGEPDRVSTWSAHSGPGGDPVEVALLDIGAAFAPEDAAELEARLQPDDDAITWLYEACEERVFPISDRQGATLLAVGFDTGVGSVAAPVWVGTDSSGSRVALLVDLTLLSEADPH